MAPTFRSDEAVEFILNCEDGCSIVTPGNSNPLMPSINRVGINLSLSSALFEARRQCTQEHFEPEVEPEMEFQPEPEVEAENTREPL